MLLETLNIFILTGISNINILFIKKKKNGVVYNNIHNKLWQTGHGGEGQVIWCLRRHQIIHDVGSLCISTLWLFNFFLIERTLKQGLQGKETSCKKGPRRI